MSVPGSVQVWEPALVPGSGQAWEPVSERESEQVLLSEWFRDAEDTLAQLEKLGVI